MNMTQNGSFATRRAEEILAAARERIIVVLGDLMLDEWIEGDTNRMSPEAPVPVVRLSGRRTAPGGAANVAMNLLRLGARVRVCGVVGDDEAGRDLKRELEEAGADVAAVIVDATRPTTLKTRVVARQQQMVRIDRESSAPFGAALRGELLDHLTPALAEAALLCVSDYDKGVVSCGALEAAQEAAQNGSVRITGGPKPRNMSCFQRADFLSLNQKEASEAAGFALESQDDIERAGQQLRRETASVVLAITRGARGVSLFRENEAPLHLPAHEVEVFDVAGAGDSFLAAVSLALAGGADAVQASRLGNLAAAASVRHTGVVAVRPDEVLGVAREAE